MKKKFTIRCLDGDDAEIICQLIKAEKGRVVTRRLCKKPFEIFRIYYEAERDLDEKVWKLLSIYRETHNAINGLEPPF